MRRVVARDRDAPGVIADAWDPTIARHCCGRDRERATRGRLIAVRASRHDVPGLTYYRQGHGEAYSTIDRRLTILFPSAPTEKRSSCVGCDPNITTEYFQQPSQSLVLTDVVVSAKSFSTSDAATGTLRRLVETGAADTGLILTSQHEATFQGHPAYEAAGHPAPLLDQAQVRVEDFYVGGHIYVLTVTAKQDGTAWFDVFAQSVRLNGS